jgi:exodeoxyribonuclease-3
VDEEELMKLMTYNILDGGGERLPDIIEIIKKESPDYLTINEANTFAKDKNKILKEVSVQTHLPYCDIALSGEYDYHVAAFSKYPFKDVQKLTPLARACLVTLVETEFGLFSIASLHLNPYSEDERHPEIDRIIDFQKQYPNRILMGDMNSLSGHDEYDPKIIQSFNEGQRKKLAPGGHFRFDAIDKIMTVGYFDTALKLSKNKENTVVPIGSNDKWANWPMRLDYIFISTPLLKYLHRYEVIKNDSTEKASDHYPVVVELSKN